MSQNEKQDIRTSQRVADQTNRLADKLKAEDRREEDAARAFPTEFTASGAGKVVPPDA